MSLIIHTIVPDGIVVCSDTRTTRKVDGNIRYDDSSEKTTPFPNGIIVSHCGDAMINSKKSVMKFLYELRDQYGEIATIYDLPTILLDNFIKLKSSADIVFLISGYDPYHVSAATYRVETKTNTIKMSCSFGEYGAAYNGETAVAHAIMNSGISYNKLSIRDAIDLTKGCLCYNIELFKYHDLQSIGGNCDTYVIDNLHSQYGWLQEDGSYKKDENADINAFEKYRRKQIQAAIRESRKTRRLSNKKKDDQ